MATITTRAAKGEPLTFKEVDDNFLSLNETTGWVYRPIDTIFLIPNNPNNGDLIEIFDSTGIESLLIIQGMPAGFVGSNEQTVRLRYSTAAGKWIWLDPKEPFILVPAKNAAGLTELIFNDIPPWAKRITCAIEGLSFTSPTGNGHLLLQAGNGSGFYTSGYKTTTQWLSGSTFAVASDSGIISYLSAPIRALTGHLVLTRCTYASSFDRWVVSGIFREDSIGLVLIFTAGSFEIPYPLTRLRFLSSDVLAPDNDRTFDAGSASIIYDG